MLCREKYQGTKRGTSVIAACGEHVQGQELVCCPLRASAPLERDQLPVRLRSLGMHLRAFLQPRTMPPGCLLV